jgi:hypothetical protein
VEASVTRTGALVGTPIYMAPEQLVGRQADARADIYSFCVSLYEALYGERPFAGTTARELLAAKAAGEVRPPSASARISPRLRRALLRGLRARPEDRYASMQALLESLERASRTPRVRIVVGASVALAAASGIFLKSRGAHLSSAPASSGSDDTGGTSAASPGTALAPPCTSHRACVDRNGGQPYVCRASDKACVPIASKDCTARFEPGDLQSDTLWFGAMFPLRGPKADAYGTMNLEGADLARKELAQATRALAGPGASLRVPRIALVACDDSEDPMRAARHLADEVGVPAIVAGGSGQEVADVAAALLVGRGVLSVASLTPSPLITRVPQPPGVPPMVWRTTFSLDDAARATAHFVQDVFEPRFRTLQRPMRVVLARDETASALSFGEAFYGTLVFNGKPAVRNGQDYQEITFASGALEASEVQRVAGRLAQVAPTLVVLLAAHEAAVPLVEALESSWSGQEPRPTYLFPNDVLAPYAAYLGRSVARRRRMFAINSDSSSTANARFVMRYNDTHTEHVGLTINPGPSYDAFYVLSYAAYALGAEAVTGTALARAFGRLIAPADPVEVGPTHVFDAVRLLAAGGRIDLHGAASGLDFDLASGEAPSDFALVCAAVDKRGVVTGDDLESGIVFRAARRRVEGALRCP